MNDEKRRKFLALLNQKEIEESVLFGPGMLKKFKRLVKYPFYYFYRLLIHAGLSPKEIQLRTFWGRKFVALASDIKYFRVCCTGSLGSCENKLTKFFIKNLKDNDVFYDVGASFGFYTMLAQEFITNGETHSFEPNIEVFGCLRRNCTTKRSFINNLAVSAKCGKVTFYLPLSGTELGSLINPLSAVDSVASLSHTKFEKTKVTAITLDEYVKTHKKPTVVKFDIEGAEQKAILGGKKTLTRSQPLITLEVWGSEAGRKFSLRSVRGLLKLGYKPHKINTAGELEMISSFGEVAKYINFLRPAGVDNLVFDKKYL